MLGFQLCRLYPSKKTSCARTMHCNLFSLRKSLASAAPNTIEQSLEKLYRDRFLKYPVLLSIGSDQIKSQKRTFPIGISHIL